jgi:DNA-binding response OmpR family regulator
MTMVRILIVEDDRPFADALASAIRPEGHDVVVAASSQEGIELGLSHQPDVVIADWVLGGDVHGGEVCRRIRAACPLVRTIIMTGYLGGDSEADRWSEYADALLEKPFHKEAILEAINQSSSRTISRVSAAAGLAPGGRARVRRRRSGSHKEGR